MPITPNHESALAVTKLMEKTLGFLHEIIELESYHPKEVMVLMMAFITGLTIQLKDKLETLKPKLGDQLLEAINLSLNPKGIETIEKLNRNDPDLNQSVSGIASDDLPGAVDFLAERLARNIGSSLSELPILLRNEMTVLHSLSLIIGDIFNRLDVRDLDASIEEFAKNVRIFAAQGDKDTSKPQGN